MCGAPFDDLVNGSYADVLLKRVLRVVLALWGVGSILRNGYRNQGQNVCSIGPGK